MKRAHVALVLLGVVSFGPALFARDVWPSVEALYAQVAREMVATGDYLLPHRNGAVYSDKPPVVFWLSAGLRALGCGAQSGRVLSALLAIATLLLTAALARLWFSRTTALLAGAIVATTAQFTWIGRTGGLDTPLAFFTTLAVWAWFAGGRALPLFYVAMGLGILVKGPIALIIPLVAVVAGKLAKLPRPSGSPAGARHLAWGVPLLLAIVAAWVVPACLRGGEEYTQDLLFRQNVTRALEAISHEHPFWWYLPRLPGIFFPWILLAIPAAGWAWRRREEPALRMLLLWGGLGMLLFFAFAGKRVRYLIPFTPALAIVVACAFEELLLRPEAPVRGWFHRLSRVQHLVFLGVGLALVAFALSFGHLPGVRPWVAGAIRPWTAWPAALVPLLCGALLAAVALAGVRAGRADRHRRSATLLVLEMAALMLVVDLVFVPRLNGYESTRPVAERMDELVPPGAGGAAVFPHDKHTSYNLYSRRLTLTVLAKPEDLVAWLEGPGHRVAVVERDALDRWRAEGHALPELAHVALERRVGRSLTLLVTNFTPGRP